MPLMIPKKQALTVIMNKLRGGAHSTSEHSSEALQAANDASVGSTAPVNDDGDEVNSNTALDAAAQSAMMAVESKDPKAFQAAIYDMFQLFELNEPQEQESGAEGVD